MLCRKIISDLRVKLYDISGRLFSTKREALLHIDLILNEFNLQRSDMEKCRIGTYHKLLNVFETYKHIKLNIKFIENNDGVILIVDLV